MPAPDPGKTRELLAVCLMLCAWNHGACPTRVIARRMSAWTGLKWSIGYVSEMRSGKAMRHRWLADALGIDPTCRSTGSVWFIENVPGTRPHDGAREGANIKDRDVSDRLLEMFLQQATEALATITDEKAALLQALYDAERKEQSDE